MQMKHQYDYHKFMINKLYLVFVLFLALSSVNGMALSKASVETTTLSSELTYTIAETSPDAQSSDNGTKEARFRNCSTQAGAVLILEICFSLTIAILIAGSSFWKASYMGTLLLILLFTAAFVHYNVNINYCLLTSGETQRDLTAIWTIKNGLYYVLGILVTLFWGRTIYKQRLDIHEPKKRDKVVLVVLLLLFAGYTIVNLFFPLF